MTEKKSLEYLMLTSMTSFVNAYMF